MNEFRSRIFSGTKSAEPEGLISAKRPRGAKADNLGSVRVPRSEHRTSDTRKVDRHRLGGETARLRHKRRQYEVGLVNVSGGGAMISSAEFEPNLWDKVELTLGEGSAVDAVVRWIKEGRIGLEFAAETRLDCSPEQRQALLRDVLARNFVDEIQVAPPPQPERAEFTDAEAADDGHRRSEARHPMIWSGHIHFNYESTPVRLRNISTFGAQIECPVALPLGAEPLLDLGEAGSVFGTVTWAKGDQAGLRFDSPFDMARLASCKPEVASASRWEAPTYLANKKQSGPDPWDRMSLSELNQELQGFLNR